MTKKKDLDAVKRALALTQDEEVKDQKAPEDIREIVTEICARHWRGETIRKIFNSLKGVVSRPLFYKWIEKYPELRDQYRRAHEGWSDEQFEKMEELAEGSSKRTYNDNLGNRRVDTGAVKAIELHINTLQFMIGRSNPKKYGPKVESDEGSTVAQIPKTVIEAEPKLDKPIK